MRLGPWALLFWAIALGSCGGERQDPVDSGVVGPGDSDGGVTPEADAGGVVVEIGTGIDDFTSVDTGQVMSMVPGAQGGGACLGYHIWFAARVTGAEPRGIQIRAAVVDPVSGAVHGDQSRVLNLMPSGGTYAVWGIAVRLEDCCVLEDADVLMRVEVKDVHGREGADERLVKASRVCPMPGSTRSICPGNMQSVCPP